MMAGTEDLLPRWLLHSYVAPGPRSLVIDAGSWLEARLGLLPQGLSMWLGLLSDHGSVSREGIPRKIIPGEPDRSFKASYDLASEM